jgi:hypothetical protein
LAIDGIIDVFSNFLWYSDALFKVILFLVSPLASSERAAQYGMILP